METTIIYALKVSIAIVVFYLLHIVLLRKETFFKFRRGYFLFALFFSLLFPFVNLANFGIAPESTVIPAFNLAEIIVTAKGTTTQVATEQADNLFNWYTLSLIVAGMGALALLSRFSVQLTSLILLIRGGKRINEDERVKILETSQSSPTPFSFFHWIVLGRNDKDNSNLTDIITHEETHARELHSVDALLYELFCIVFWWNPFAWLMKNEVKLNLEYLADEKVLTAKTDYKEYQYTLLQISIANTGMAFINNFNVLHLKKRITMMNKKRSPILAMAKYLLMLPLALLLIQCNSEKDENKNEQIPPITAIPAEATEATDAIYSMEMTETLPEKIFDVVEKMPQFPGGETELFKYLGESLRYPVSAQEVGAQGRVIVKFVIDQDGKVVGVQSIKNSISLKNNLDEVVITALNNGKEEKTTITLDDAKKMLEKEAIRVVKAMPNWEPGVQNGKKVATYFTLPILYKLK